MVFFQHPVFRLFFLIGLSFALLMPQAAQAENKQVETYVDQAVPLPAGGWPYDMPISKLKADDWGIGAKAREKYEQMNRPYRDQQTITPVPSQATSISTGTVQLQRAKLKPFSPKDLTTNWDAKVAPQEDTVPVLAQRVDVTDTRSANPRFEPKPASPDLRPFDAATGQCVSKTVQWTRSCSDVGYPGTFQGQVVGQTKVLCPEGDLEDTWLSNTCAPSGTVADFEPVTTGNTSLSAATTAVANTPKANEIQKENGTVSVAQLKPDQVLPTPSSASRSALPVTSSKMQVDSSDVLPQYDVRVLPNGQAIVTPIAPKTEKAEQASTATMPSSDAAKVVSMSPHSKSTSAQVMPSAQAVLPSALSRLVVPPASTLSSETKAVAIGQPPSATANAAAIPALSSKSSATVSPDFTATVLDGKQDFTAENQPQSLPPLVAQPPAIMPQSIVTETAVSPPVKLMSSPDVASAAQLPTSQVTVISRAGDMPKASGTDEPKQQPQSLAQETNANLPVVAVDGRCGSVSDSAVAALPKDGLCALGIVGEVNGNGPWFWTCEGVGGGKTAECSAAASMAEGHCGAANGAPASRAPTAYLCESGVSTDVTGSGPWTWSCNGTGGGSTAQCKAPYLAPESFPGFEQGGAGRDLTMPPASLMVPNAPLPSPKTDQESQNAVETPPSVEKTVTPSEPTPIPVPAMPTVVSEVKSGASQIATTAVTVDTSLCGKASKIATVMAPTTDLCLSGSAGDVTGEGPWVWTCKDGDKTSSCTAQLPVLAECGPAYGRPSSSAPTQDLCASGTPSIVTGVGPWMWNCDGGEGGTAVSCTAPVGAGEAPVPTASPTLPVEKGAAMDNGPAAKDAPIATQKPAMVDVAEAKAHEPVDGVCGMASEDSTKPAKQDQCSEGVPSKLKGKGPWSWTCSGKDGGKTAACKTVKQGKESRNHHGKNPQLVSGKQPGMCGVANRGAYNKQPNERDLCKSGVASLVRGKGPWTWACIGLDGGGDESCVAGADGQETAVQSTKVADAFPAFSSQNVRLAIQPPAAGKLQTPKLNDSRALALIPPTQEPQPAEEVRSSTIVDVPAPATAAEPTTSEVMPQVMKTTNAVFAGVKSYAPEEPLRSLGDQTAKNTNNIIPVAAVSASAKKLGDISFSSGEAAIGSGDMSDIADYATALKNNPQAQLVITAYAPSGDMSTREARRLSLSRAVAVRDALIAQGAEGSRIDVRAMGANVESGSADRADIMMQ